MWQGWEWVCGNEMVPALAHWSPVPRSHQVTSARATERQCCTFQPNKQQNVLQHRSVWLLPHSCFHPAVAAQGSSVGKGSATPCGPHNPFLESCCLVFFIGFGIGQLRMDFGWKKTQRLATVLLLCCAPVPFLAGSIIFSLGCGVLEMLWRVVGICRGDCNMPNL